MKKLLFSLISLLPVFASAQTISKYYDFDWMETSREKATYVSEFTKVESGYQCISYWKSSNKKKEESLYADTSMTKPNGLQKVYHKNGKLEDSLRFNAEGKLLEGYHFFANGKLECHYVSTANGKGNVVEAFDESGAKIKNYVYVRPAEPKGGAKKWESYVLKNANRELNTGTETAATAKAVIRFVVDEEVYVVKAKVIASSGFKSVDQDALRLIQGSPQWVPAIYKNKPFRYPLNLPVTYELPAAIKK